MTDADRDAYDLAIAKLFASPDGRVLLAIMEANWLVLTAAGAREAIQRVAARHWSTGGPIRTL